MNLISLLDFSIILSYTILRNSKFILISKTFSIHSLFFLNPFIKKRMRVLYQSMLKGAANLFNFPTLLFYRELPTDSIYRYLLSTSNW